MTDITKCKGIDCPDKLSCYRHMAKSGFRQSFFAQTPYDRNKKVVSIIGDTSHRPILTQNLLNSHKFAIFVTWSSRKIYTATR